jgi:cysteinyl-tRNA synthetase
MTVRTDGASTTFPSGTILSLDDVRATAEGRGGHARQAVAQPSTASEAAAAVASSPLLADATRLETVFADALARRDVSAAVAAVLELEEVLVAWSADTLQSDEPDRARAVLRSMIVRLGEVAVTGARDPRLAVTPFVELLLGLRAAARTAKDFATSDTIRDGLVAAGIEVRDTADGAEWDLAG